jgi:hypothetical protein
MSTRVNKRLYAKTRPVKRKKRRAVNSFLMSGVVVGAAALAAAFFAPPPFRQSPPSPCRPRPRPAATAPLDPSEARAAADLPNPQAPVLVIRDRRGGVPFVLIAGGTVQTRRSPRRCGVSEFVKGAGARAGLNGTFFADASLRGTDHLLIGPTLCGDEARAVFNRSDSARALTGRPLVLLSPTRTRILPYRPAAMASQAALAARLPGLSDAFLGGVWLVHGGVAGGRAALDAYHVQDAEDPRRRAFFCLMPDGRPALGATTYVTPSAALARALQAEGVREAVLLDSGFSTSLVYGRNILVTGHTSPGIPSRPVPHALVLFGRPAPPVPKAEEMAGRF